MSATAINIRGNMKRVLREHFPNLPDARVEAIAEQLADVAREYADEATGSHDPDRSDHG